MSIELRPYQSQIISETYAKWAAGVKNVLIQLATGTGKTVIFTKIMADSPVPSIAIAHRVELVSQISMSLAQLGVRHNIIAQKPAIRNIIGLHLAEFNKSYYDPQSKTTIAGVDTLVKLNTNSNPWMAHIGLVVQDEGHHPLKSNKWGFAASLFPNAYGLYPTATPVRADGKGLGRPADGLMDSLIVGPSMRSLINDGYLSDYRIFAPPSDLDLSHVPVSPSGDYSPPKLRTAVHKSHITGDVVKHYLRIAPGKLGVTFAVDIEAAVEIANEFKAAGVSAEVISSKTPDFLRYQIMKRFRAREILQLVNVDLLGEGVDVPAIEVVSMARPTQSYAVYSQQFGRALRPLPCKSHAIIIDHVSNVMRHGLPDAPRAWSLERREKVKRHGPQDVIPVRTCLNPDCLAVYERVHRLCPFCGHFSPPAARSAPEFTDGDLLELDPSVLAVLRGEIERIDRPAYPPQGLDNVAQHAVVARHNARQLAQNNLRAAIALWAGHQKLLNREDSEIYRRFYFLFGVDIATAQTLNAADAVRLQDKIEGTI